MSKKLRLIIDAVIRNETLILTVNNRVLHENCAQVIKALQANESITRLVFINDIYLHDYSITDNEAKILADVLIKRKTRLQTIQINNENIGNQGFKALFSALKDDRLIEINLANNRLNGEITEYLADFLKQNPLLQSLNLSDNNFRDNDSVTIISALHNNPSLASLSFANNPICAEGVKELVSLINNSNKLVNLCFFSNITCTIITDDHANAQLIDAAQNKNLLQSLKLFPWVEERYNCIEYANRGRVGDQSLELLSKWLMRADCSLKELYIIFDPKVSIAGMKKFATAVAVNKSLTSLVTRNIPKCYQVLLSESDNKLIQAILRVIKSNNLFDYMNQVVSSKDGQCPLIHIKCLSIEDYQLITANPRLFIDEVNKFFLCDGYGENLIQAIEQYYQSHKNILKSLTERSAVTHPRPTSRATYLCKRLGVEENKFTRRVSAKSVAADCNMIIN